MITLCVPDTHIRRGGCRGEEIRLMADVMWVGFFLFRGGKKQDAAQPREEKLCGVITGSLPVSEGACKEAGEGFFVRNCRDGTRDNGIKLKKAKFRLDIRRKLFCVRVGRP